MKKKDGQADPANGERAPDVCESLRDLMLGGAFRVGGEREG